jgi:hypothetical protein
MLSVVLLAITISFANLPTQLIKYSMLESQCTNPNMTFKLMYAGNSTKAINVEFARRVPTVVTCESKLLLNYDYMAIEWPKRATVMFTGSINVDEHIAKLKMKFGDTYFVANLIPSNRAFAMAKYISMGASLSKAVSMLLDD